MTHYDVYGRMAAADLSDTSQNGRYLAQQEAEALVPADVMRKLAINAEDRFLDIGCGLGLSLVPICDIVKHAVGCDHPLVIEKLKRKHPALKAELFSGNFTELEIKGTFTKILAYSVLPALPDRDILYRFVDKALELLSPEGRMLLGDLANQDKKRRFAKSKRGELFQKEWERICSEKNSEDLSVFHTEDDAAVLMDDRFIFDLAAHIRDRGFHAYVVDQPQSLPFGNTREDILVVGPEYEEKQK